MLFSDIYSTHINKISIRHNPFHKLPARWVKTPQGMNGQAVEVWSTRKKKKKNQIGDGWKSQSEILMSFCFQFGLWRFLSLRFSLFSSIGSVSLQVYLLLNLLVQQQFLDFYLLPGKAIIQLDLLKLDPNVLTCPNLEEKKFLFFFLSWFRPTKLVILRIYWLIID